MSRPEDEIASLARELRAHLESARDDGWLTIPRMEPVAHSVLKETSPAPEGTGRQGAPVAVDASPWGEIAREERRLRERPRGAAGLHAAREELGACERCRLHKGRENIVFGGGDPEADLMVIGEAPGYHEDQRGEPFVGPAGEMLNKMLVHVLGLNRSHTYILNMVKCRPPENRNPEPDEVDACRPFFEQQVEAIQPKVMLVLGRVAFGALFDTSEGIKRSRGVWREYRGIPVMPTFHPAYLLRQPQDKRLTFDDLKVLRARYDQLGGKR